MGNFATASHENKKHSLEFGSLCLQSAECQRFGGPPRGGKVACFMPRKILIKPSRVGVLPANPTDERELAL